MKKERITLPDGRYLIFYRFDEEESEVGKNCSCADGSGDPSGLSRVSEQEKPDGSGEPTARNRTK